MQSAVLGSKKARFRIGTVVVGLCLLSLGILAANRRVLSPPRSNVPDHSLQEPSISSDYSAGRDNKPEEEKRTTYKGVSFVCDRSLASDIKAETATAVVLERAGDKPDSATPKHTVFSLLGPYAELHRSSFFHPQLMVYQLDSYKRALAASPDDVKALEHIVQQLTGIIGDSTRTPSRDTKLPFLPYGIDGSQTFHAHFKVLSFPQGRGIAYITQYNSEPALISNDRLVYTFQGITYDRKYYVAATFPVSLKYLPNDSSATSWEGYEMKWPKTPGDWDEFDKSFEKYLAQVTARISESNESEFEPRLATFERVIQSLDVRPEE